MKNELKHIIQCDRSKLIPLYYQLSQQFIDKINSKHFTKDEKLPTEFELAEEFGINRLTARQVYNYLEKAGYVYRIKSRGTFVKDVNNRNNLIAIVLFQNTDYTVKITEGVEYALEKMNFHMIVKYSDVDLVKEEKIISELVKMPELRGIIICPAVRKGKSNETLFYKFKKTDKHIVIIERQFNGNNYDFVGFNNFEAGYAGTGHLMKSNHKNFLFLASSSMASSIKEKLKGFDMALREKGIPQANRATLFLPFAEKGYLKCVELLEVFLAKLKTQRNLPIAIFSVMEPLTKVAYCASLNLGLNIPDDVSLIGFDDNDAFDILDTPITTIKPPLIDLGRISTELLLSRINGLNGKIKHIELPICIIPRRSCGEK